MSTIIYTYSDLKRSSKYFESRQLLCKEYRLRNKLHRLDGPAKEYYDGRKEYYVDGELHRLEGPAIEHVDGSNSYYLKGLRHRLDGPAIEWGGGFKKYYVYGKLHRSDGPAVESPNGYKEYWVNDINVTPKLHGLKNEDIPKYLRMLSL